MSDTIRISVPIDRKLNDDLTTICRWGVKAQAIRELIVLLVETQKRESEYIVEDLLKGRLELRRSNFEQVDGYDEET